MRHRVKKTKIKLGIDYNTALVRNLAMSVIIYDKIKTTAAKAKAVQPFVEKLITIAKKTESKREAIREIEKLLQHKNSSKKIFEVLLDKYKDRDSGFTRITKLGYRSGDNAPVVQIELV
ncbi:MAG: 50S ribosomal protein L17 [Candidatus Gracilibacteria bacterium]|nr:50S ribosomal protein L17 [Candidatus Gracilibacteria bacterium]